MKFNITTAFPASKRFFLPPLFGLLVLGAIARAQQETIQPVAPAVESTSQIAMTNGFQIFPAHPAPTAPQQYEPFRWDQFVLRPHVDYQFIDAFHLLAAPSNQVNTTIQRLSPGFLLNLGPHWALDYTLTLAWYSNTNFGTEVDHSITLTGQTVYGDWIFGLLQGVLLSSSPLIEFGGQTYQEYFNTVVTGHHEDNQYFSEDLSLNQNFQIYPGNQFEDSRAWSTIDWLNYQPQSHFNIGIGPGLGYVNSEIGPDSVFEQLEGRVNWRLSDRISLQVAGGFSETEFLGAQGNGDLFSPIYSGSLQFKPFSETELSVFASRSVTPSPFAGQYTEDSSVGASLTQRFLKQFYFSVDGAYTKQKYVASAYYAFFQTKTNLTFVLINPARTDDYYTFSARLSHSFLQRGNVSIFYLYSSDKSTLPGYTFSGNQFGGEVSYSF
ncbi:MAG TPA: hypothetical protein VNV43_10725 [Candidatus Acidoferrales bacterium]|jgi:hypothetical protein|nr:hypothetical protein [Candidatus Acidoferrales bacterium]